MKRCASIACASTCRACKTPFRAGIRKTIRSCDSALSAVQKSSKAFKPQRAQRGAEGRRGNHKRTLDLSDPITGSYGLLGTWFLWSPWDLLRRPLRCIEDDEADCSTDVTEF